MENVFCALVKFHVKGQRENCDSVEGWDEVGGQFKREGTYVNLWLIHVDVWQKLTQYCKAVIIQLKIKKKKRMSLELAGNPQERSLTEKSTLKS